MTRSRTTFIVPAGRSPDVEDRPSHGTSSVSPWGDRGASLWSCRYYRRCCRSKSGAARHDHERWDSSRCVRAMNERMETPGEPSRIIVALDAMDDRASRCSRPDARTFGISMDSGCWGKEKVAGEFSFGLRGAQPQENPFFQAHAGKTVCPEFGKQAVSVRKKVRDENA